MIINNYELLIELLQIARGQIQYIKESKEPKTPTQARQVSQLNGEITYLEGKLKELLNKDDIKKYLRTNNLTGKRFQLNDKFETPEKDSNEKVHAELIDYAIDSTKNLNFDTPEEKTKWITVLKSTTLYQNSNTFQKRLGIETDTHEYVAGRQSFISQQIDVILNDENLNIQAKMQSITMLIDDESKKMKKRFPKNDYPDDYFIKLVFTDEFQNKFQNIVLSNPSDTYFPQQAKVAVEKILKETIQKEYKISLSLLMTNIKSAISDNDKNFLREDYMMAYLTSVAAANPGYQEVISTVFNNGLNNIVVDNKVTNSNKLVSISTLLSNLPNGLLNEEGQAKLKDSLGQILKQLSSDKISKFDYIKSVQTVLDGLSGRSDMVDLYNVLKVNLSDKISEYTAEIALKLNGEIDPVNRINLIQVQLLDFQSKLAKYQYLGEYYNLSKFLNENLNTAAQQLISDLERLDKDPQISKYHKIKKLNDIKNGLVVSPPERLRNYSTQLTAEYAKDIDVEVKRIVENNNLSTRSKIHRLNIIENALDLSNNKEYMRIKQNFLSPIILMEANKIKDDNKLSTEQKISQLDEIFKAINNLENKNEMLEPLKNIEMELVQNLANELSGISRKAFLDFNLEKMLNASEKNPYMSQWAQYSQNVSNYVNNIVCSEPNLDARVRKVSFLIKVAESCRTNADYATTIAIYTALNSGISSQLLITRNKLAESEKRLLLQANATTDKDRGWMHEMSAHNGLVVPDYSQFAIPIRKAQDNNLPWSETGLAESVLNPLMKYHQNIQTAQNVREEEKSSNKQKVEALSVVLQRPIPEAYILTALVEKNEKAKQSYKEANEQLLNFTSANQESVQNTLKQTLAQTKAKKPVVGKVSYDIEKLSTNHDALISQYNVEIKKVEAELDKFPIAKDPTDDTRTRNLVKETLIEIDKILHIDMKNELLKPNEQYENPLDKKTNLADKKSNIVVYFNMIDQSLQLCIDQLHERKKHYYYPEYIKAANELIQVLENQRQNYRQIQNNLDENLFKGAIMLPGQLQSTAAAKEPVKDSAKPAAAISSATVLPEHQGKEKPRTEKGGGVLDWLGFTRRPEVKGSDAKVLGILKSNSSSSVTSAAPPTPSTELAVSTKPAGPESHPAASPAPHIRAERVIGVVEKHKERLNEAQSSIRKGHG